MKGGFHRFTSENSGKFLGPLKPRLGFFQGDPQRKLKEGQGGQGPRRPRAEGRGPSGVPFSNHDQGYFSVN